MPLSRSLLVAHLLVLVLPLSVSAAQEERGAAWSLHAAITKAAAGDTVRVPAGVHHGLFRIERSITLVGEPGAVLDGEGKGTVVTVTADSVTLSSFRVIGTGMSLDDDQSAVRLERCKGCIVERLVIERPLHGIYLADVTGARLSHNLIIGDTAIAEARRGNGIHLYNSGAVRITGNFISGTRDGIYFSFASGNQVDSNHVTRVRYGLHYMYSNDNTFERNRFLRNAAGGAIMFSERIVLRNNEFSEHVGFRAYGLLLQTTSDVLAENNRFSGNLIGLFIDNSTRTMLRNNAVAGNGIGVDLLPSSRDNTLTENWFLGNRTPVRVARGSGRSTWAVNGRGNYWGDASVFDLDGNGVGDRPLRVGDAFATLAQARPALELFTNTPAARALSWAEEALPAFRLLRIEDPAPLVGRFFSQTGNSSLPVVTGGTLLLIMVLIGAGNVKSHALRSRRRGACEVKT